jgi:hypothetical protein
MESASINIDLSNKLQKIRLEIRRYYESSYFLIY